MILIDSLYINNGGGKVLLEYLVSELEKSDLEVFYLFDERCKDDFKSISNNRKKILKASTYNRYLFYSKNKSTFNHVFCFANLAPPINVSANVYTYFHQKLFLKVPDSIGFKQRTLIRLKTFIFKIFLSNSDFWIVQSDIVAGVLSEVNNLKKDRVLTLPFYPSLKIEGLNEDRIDNSFIYVSNGASHKNHHRLIKAFCAFYDKHKIGQLTLTISSNFDEICSIIKEKASQGYPIYNIGLVKRNELTKYYLKSDFLVFPSLSESFGLGIVEAIENGCKVIGSNLPYMYAVCNPSITFDPYSVESISNALEMSLVPNLKPTQQILFNEIDSILQLFIDNENQK